MLQAALLGGVEALFAALQLLQAVFVRAGAAQRHLQQLLPREVIYAAAKGAMGMLHWSLSASSRTLGSDGPKAPGSIASTTALGAAPAREDPACGVHAGLPAARCRSLAVVLAEVSPLSPAEVAMLARVVAW
jgi:hypothetical protein